MRSSAFGDALQAESIDHTGTRLSTPTHGVTAEYGEYLVNTGDCRGCHGETLSGAQMVAPPCAPFAHNLTPGGELAGWTAADFINTMRTGETPTGREIGEFMPWEHIGRMTDDDLTTLFLYLQALPAQETIQ